MATRHVEDLLLRLAHLKSAQEELAKQATVASEELIVALQASGRDSVVKTLDNGDTIKGTLVAPQRVNIDADRLKGALSGPQWKKVTTLVLDKAKLEAAMSVNVIDPNTVAGCTTLVDTKPYIKISGKYSPGDAAMAYAKLPVRKVRAKARSAAAAVLDVATT